VVVADRADTDVLVPLHGVPVLVRSVRGLLGSGVVDDVVVLVASADVDEARRLLCGLPVSVGDDAAEAARTVARRSAAGAVVLVHDGTRPLTPPALAEAVTRAVDGVHGAAVPVLPLADTVKHVRPDGSIHSGPDRAGLRVVQTPQAFGPGLLDEAASARLLATDRVEWAYTAVDAPVVIVDGHPHAFPVRSAWDRELAEALGVVTA
jgi:2-C-methyl-D-erythritol 4-phosphate cytidylyltransferase